MEAVCDNMDVLSLDVEIIDEYIESKKDIKKATKRIEIDLVARITKHMKDPNSSGSVSVWKICVKNTNRA